MKLRIFAIISAVTLLLAVTAYLILNKINDDERKIDTEAMENLFLSVGLTSGYKQAGENNPLYTQRFGADPGVMEWGGRLYVYTTNDVIEYDENGNVQENTYGQKNVTSRHAKS